MTKFQKQKPEVKEASLRTEKSHKSVTVELFERETPRFTFSEGDWHGKDIRLIGRSIARAYLKHQQSVRRGTPEVVVSELIETESAKESNNG